MFEIEGRLGFFQVVDERGCVLALFSPPDDDMESNRLRQTVKPEARLIWCFLDEQDVNASSESKNPFVGRAVGAIVVEEQEMEPGQPDSKVLVATGVWQQCEEYLLRMNCRHGAEAVARKPQL